MTFWPFSPTCLRSSPERRTDTPKMEIGCHSPPGGVQILKKSAFGLMTDLDSSATCHRIRNNLLHKNNALHDICRKFCRLVPGSHAGELFDQYDKQGQWKGCLNASDVERLDLTRAAYVEAGAGAITVHNCRTVHGSPPSRNADGRPLLLNAYASADAFPYTPHPEPAPHVGEVIRGQPAKWAHHDPRPCLIPPDWSSGYTSIFAAQAGEDDPDGARDPRAA